MRVSGSSSSSRALGNRKVALKSLVNSKYVTAEKAGTQPLIANRTAVGPWEKFNLFR